MEQSDTKAREISLDFPSPAISRLLRTFLWNTLSISSYTTGGKRAKQESENSLEWWCDGACTHGETSGS